MTEVLISLRYETLTMALQWAWKLARVPPLKTYPLAGHEIVESFEKRNLWREAQEIAELCLSMDVPDMEDLDFLNLNRWLCIQQQGHMADTIADIQAWQPGPENATIGRAALLRDYDECYRLLKED
jgi:hypothetical protein